MNYFRSNRFLDTLPDWETGQPPTGPLDDYLPRMRALLARLGNPQAGFKTVIVGGTNGKGTTSSMLDTLLRACGRRVGLYTSPHLHTVRERIRIDGEVAARDLWADGVTTLYEKSRDFEREGLGAFSKFEALTALAALMFAQADVEYGIFEVGLGGRYDATNAWDSEMAVLTAIQLDHTATLGDTRLAIAQDKLHIARAGHPLFTTVAQAPDVTAFLKAECDQRHIPLVAISEDLIDAPDRPATFRQNASVAVAVARAILGDDLRDQTIDQVVADYQWPGRFEMAQTDPLVVLDGAHNPDAARALVSELQRLADGWTFVVGVNEGHDAEGILAALAPLAVDVVLTQSTHPKAIPAADLIRLAPAPLNARCESNGLTALQSFLETPPTVRPICVMGSLYLVALAREVLNLPHEQDSFSEDVILESLRCLETACRNLGVSYAPVSGDGNVIRAVKEGRPLYFMRNKHPFNDYVGGRLAEDKGYQNELFGQAGLAMPKTMTVFNPLADRRFDRYKTHASVDDIVADVAQQFDFPVVVKRNRGSMAQGVYLELDATSLRLRLQDLCKDSGRFENVFLIQAFVEGPEFRIVASQDQLLLAYEKQNDPELDSDSGDLNPLHRAGGIAIPVVDDGLLADFADLARRVNGVINLGFYAIDLIVRADGFSILEINPNPVCHFYNSHNGRGDFVQVYEYLVRKYLLGETPIVPTLPEARLATSQG